MKMEETMFRNVGV